MSRLRAAGPRTLRGRLVVVSVALLAAACAVLGLVSVLTMQAYLVDRLDGQLTAAVSRTARFEPPPADHVDEGLRPHGGPDFLLAPGQGEGTLGAVVEDDDVTSVGVLDASGTRVSVPASDAAVLADVPRDGSVTTVTLGDAGQYRVAAVTMPDGVTLVTGLPTSGVRAIVGRLAAVAVGLGLAVVAAGGLAARALVRRTLRPLDRVAATAREVTSTPLHAGEVRLDVRVPAGLTDARTEVGQVGAALDQLLDHVAAALSARQASETKVRQFVADASHELRTPLAAIRGYAELSRRSRATTPPEVGQCLDRVEAAAVRMTGLVEDLLLLARLDAGRGTETSDVDLSRLTLDCLADAQAAGPDHRWRAVLPDEPVVVRGDGARLHQVLANLLTNARVHTPAGTQVTLRLALDDGGRDALVEVEDDGPGIPASLLPHVFERFARGDTSRARAAGGTGSSSSGLGLAIASALVEAHGGRLTALSRPGRTVLRMALPVPTAAAQPALGPRPPRPVTVKA